VRDDEFEWDDAKDAQNIADHGVTFELARSAFDDPNWMDFDDPDPDEERYNRICMLGGQLYVINYTERGIRTRIISARRAEKHEQRKYFDRQA
jgi:hypothetical protein